MLGPLGRQRSLKLAFGDATCLPDIRRWLRANVDDGDVTMNAELVCTELVTNAVEHGGGHGDLRIEITDDGQRVTARGTTGVAPPLPSPGVLATFPGVNPGGCPPGCPVNP